MVHDMAVFRCAEVSYSSCLSTAHACATARVAHTGRTTYIMVVVRLLCTGSQHTVNAVTNAGNGCRYSAAASGCLGCDAKMLCSAVVCGLYVCMCACLYPQPISSQC